MRSDRGLAYVASVAVIFALGAFIVVDLPHKETNMAAYRTKDDIRVVTYLPDDVNRKLQAFASLEGITKQELTARILGHWVDNSEDKLPRKSAPKKVAAPSE